MAAPANRYFAAWAAAVRSRASRPSQSRGLRLAWGLFVLFGIPLALMAVLNLLAPSGYYIEPLRLVWRPWPSDLVKTLIGIAGFATTLAYLTYCKGKASGVKFGALAATATARNVAEGRIPVTGEPAPSDASMATVNPPFPPPPAGP